MWYDRASPAPTTAYVGRGARDWTLEFIHNAGLWGEESSMVDTRPLRDLCLWDLQMAAGKNGSTDTARHDKARQAVTSKKSSS